MYNIAVSINPTVYVVFTLVMLSLIQGDSKMRSIFALITPLVRYAFETAT